MECSYCNRGAVYYAEHFGKFFCKKHFKSYIEKRLKRYIYKQRAIEPGDVVLVSGKERLAYYGAVLALVKVTEKWPVKICYLGKEKIEGAHLCNGEKSTKVYEALFIEDLAAEQVKKIIDEKYEPPRRNIFSLFSEKEMALYAYIHGFKPLYCSREEEIEKIKLILTRYFSTGSLINFLKVEDSVWEQQQP